MIVMDTVSHSWQSIKADMKRRIAEREWLPGELVPSELELAREFGCARATVNRAMQELANSGFVERRRKAGTRVSVYPVRSATLKIPLVRDEVERKGAVWHHSLLGSHVTKSDAVFARKNHLKENTPVLFLDTLHFADREPYAYEERWISLQTVPEAKKVDFEQISANEWLVQNAPFTRGDISFSAVNATTEQASFLAIEEGTSIFCVERMTWMEDNPVTLVRLFYGPGYKMQTTL